MPLLTRQTLERRDSSSNKTFTIIFVLVIVFVAFICLIWGFLLPKWRKRHPGRPSSTRFNGLGKWAARYGTGRPKSLLQYNETSNNINQTPRRFPAHPGVMARSDKVPPRPPGAVLVYNPRMETPFPNSPPTTTSVTIPYTTPRPDTSVEDPRSTDYGRGSFSPSLSELTWPKAGRGDMIGQVTEMTEYNAGARFGDAKEYILAVPEPLTLRPRGAGRPPPLMKQLEKFPMPQSSSYGSSDEMHPNKLFAKLEQISHRDSISNATGTSKSQRGRDNTLSDITSESSRTLAKNNFYEDNCQYLCVVPKKALKTARGDFSTASSSHIHRAGTITRPRTPVAEYRELYERAAAEARSQPFRSISLKRELTPSTEPLTASPAPFSIIRSMSTPPTSVKMPNQKLPLLPTPLRLNRDQSTTFSSPTPEVLRGNLSFTPSSAALPESPDKLAPLRKNVRSKRPYRKSIGFYHRSGKRRPAGLSLKDSLLAISPQKLDNRKSKAGIGTMLAPETAAKSTATRLSVGQGSSRYSRDTKGMSIVRTPVSAHFSTPARSEFQILHYPEEGPRRKSLELIRSKIDCWNLHTDDMHLDPNQHAPCIKHARTYSDIGPRSPTVPTGSDVFKLEGSSDGDIADTLSSPKLSIPRICVAGGSEDVFTDKSERPPTRGKERLRAEQSAFSTWTTSDSNLSSMMGRIAPGNAEWI